MCVCVSVYVNLFIFIFLFFVLHVECLLFDDYLASLLHAAALLATVAARLKSLSCFVFVSFKFLM